MKSFKKSYLSHAVAAAVASTLPGFAVAQDDEASEIEEIIVTGSRSVCRATLCLCLLK